MKKTIGLLLLAAVMSVSCEQQEIVPSVSRKAVEFTTSSSYVGTKTSYQGTVQDGEEAILWTDGDVFSITCAQAEYGDDSKTSVNYKVTASDGVATSVTPSTSDDQIFWGEGDHTFYAAYPYGKLAGNVITDRLSPSQKMTETSDNVFAPSLSSYGYMYAVATANPDAGTVNLVFKPYFSTFEFTVSSSSNADVEVSGFSLVADTNLAGDFTATLSTTEDPELSPGTSTANVITASFGTNGKVTLSKDEQLTFSVIALPIVHTGLKARFTVNGQTVEFPLNRNNVPISFPAGRKARIRALGILGPEAVAAGITTVINNQGVDDYDLTVTNP